MYDSTTAADVIAQRVSIGSQCPRLCKLGCALHRLAMLEYNISDCHIHSHRMHPYNEYADAICTYYMKHPPPIFGYDFAPLALRDARALALYASIRTEDIEAAIIVDVLPEYRYMVLDETVTERIDKHSSCDLSSQCNSATHNFVQYNVRTLKGYKLRNSAIILFNK